MSSPSESAEVAEAIAAAREAVSSYGSSRQGFGKTWEPFGKSGSDNARFKDRLLDDRAAVEASLHKIARVARREALREVVSDEEAKISRTAMLDERIAIRARRLLRDAEA